MGGDRERAPLLRCTSNSGLEGAGSAVAGSKQLRLMIGSERSDRV